MSNAPSLKEPSMEEILASIRRIIESGDDRAKPRGDILHDHHEHHDHEHPADDRHEEPADGGAAWPAPNLGRAFEAANADSPLAVSIEAGMAVEDAGAGRETETARAAAVDAPPAGVFVAERPDDADLPEAVSRDETPLIRPATRVPRREAMSRRTDLSEIGRSLGSAYGRGLPPVAAPQDAAGEGEPDRDPDGPAMSVTPAAVPEVRMMIDAAVAPAATGGRPADAVAAGSPTGFEDDAFSAELRQALASDPLRRQPPDASDPPSVITAASALMSEAAGAQVAAAFDSLASAIRDGQMKSMDDMAREMLRPMLQEWLDGNLPRIVERMVREEIERVSRGQRG